MDSGADVSIIKLDSFCQLNILNKNEAIALDGFTNNSVKTLGTCLGNIKINCDVIKQKFHVVPNSVKMYDYDIILGRDFLSNNKTVIDFGTGNLYIQSPSKEIKIIVKNKGLIRNGESGSQNYKNASQNKHKTKVTTSQNHNRYACLPIEDDDILYADENQLDSLVTQNFEKDEMEEFKHKQYEILMGCTKGKIFCSNKMNFIARRGCVYDSRDGGLSINVITIKQQKSKPFICLDKPKAMFCSDNLCMNDMPSRVVTVTKGCISARTKHINRWCDDKYGPETINLGNISVITGVNIGRRSYANQHLNNLKSYCSNSFDQCNVNLGNFGTISRAFYDDLVRFENCLKKGTSLIVISNTLNVYNDLLMEIQKYLLLSGFDSINKKNAIFMAKATHDFNSLSLDNFTLEEVLKFICLLKQRVLEFIAIVKGRTNELVNPEIESKIKTAINTVFCTKQIITLPARSERIVSFIIKSNEPQLCAAREIQSGVYVANCVVQPKNNIGVISILNTREIDIFLYEVHLDMRPIGSYNIMSFSKQNETNSRLERLLSKIDMSHLNSEESKAIETILEEYKDIFFLENDKLTFTSTIKHSIDLLPGTKPINIRPYRLPMSQREEINRQIGKLLDEGIISRSNSAWNSPLLLVPKKAATDEKKFRLVLDYRGLNEVTVGDSFPMVSISDLLNSIGYSRFFSTLDLVSGYHQIEVDSASKHLTAFSTGAIVQKGENLGDQFEFNRLPFGLKNAPATFNRLMRTAMSGLQGIACLIFLDDIIVFSHSLEEHISKLTQVFNRLRDHNLKLQPEKCNFLRKEVTYLGHLISQEGIKLDPNKIVAVSNFPRPTTQKSLKSLLGLTNFYRSHIQGYSDISHVLYALLKKNVNFVWTSACEDAFCALKKAITSKPILQHPNFEKRFILTTDASSVAISGILSQGPIGKDLPVAFISRTLQPAETRYSTTEKEMLAIFWGIRQLRCMLLGVPFIVLTDHRALQWIFKVKDSFSRIFRWRMQLAEYDFVVIYKPGKLNLPADCLSRYVPENANNTGTSETNVEELKCNVLTRAAAKQKERTENEIKEKETNEDMNECVNNDIELKTILDEQNYENCVLFMDKYIDKCVNNLFEKSICHKRNGNEIMFVAHDAIILMKSDILTLAKRLFLRIENEIYIFYVVTTYSCTNRMSFKEFFEVFMLIKEFLLENELKDICYVKRSNIELNLNHIKVKQMLRYLFCRTEIEFTIFLDERIILTNQIEIQRVMKENHDNVLGGHTGIKRTIAKLKEIYFWKSMKKDIVNYIKNCEACQKNKITRKTKMPMVISSTATKGAQRWALDIVGPLPQSIQGFVYILTCQDDLTRYIVAIPLRDQETDTIARAFVENIVLKFGSPQQILTDRGQSFLSNLLKRVCKLLNIKKIHTTAYHPEGNGALERSHRVIKEYLRSYVNKNLNDWDNYLPFAIFNYNTTPHSSTTFSPHELMFATKATQPASIYQNPAPVYNYDDYYFELRHKLQEAHKFARENLIQSKNKSKTYYDRKTNNLTLQIGDLVLLENMTNKKLGPRYDGPYEVITIISDVNTKIRIGNKEKIVHNNHLKIFYKD